MVEFVGLHLQKKLVIGKTVLEKKKGNELELTTIRVNNFNPSCRKGAVAFIVK